MAVRRVLCALVVSVTLALSGCGSDTGPDDAAAIDDTAATGAQAPAAQATARSADAAPTGKAKAGKAGAGGSPAPTVAPEVVVPTTSDAGVRPVSGSWQDVTLAGLKNIDLRLVADEKLAIKRVRAACEAFSSGMFAEKAITLVKAKFSTAQFQVTQDLAGEIYQMILQTACYVMNE